jgi:hypothetical protein
LATNTRKKTVVAGYKLPQRVAAVDPASKVGIAVYIRLDRALRTRLLDRCASAPCEILAQAMHKSGLWITINLAIPKVIRPKLTERIVMLRDVCVSRRRRRVQCTRFDYLLFCVTTYLGHHAFLDIHPSTSEGDSPDRRPMPEPGGCLSPPYFAPAPIVERPTRRGPCEYAGQRKTF